MKSQGGKQRSRDTHTEGQHGKREGRQGMYAGRKEGEKKTSRRAGR